MAARSSTGSPMPTRCKTEKGARETFGKGDVRGVIASESLQQRQGGRRAGADRGVRHSRQRRHGDPARRVPDPRPGAGSGHADQEPQVHLLDGVVGGARQHSRRRHVLPVLQPVRQARDAALHADHAVGAGDHLHRRVRGQPQLGRPLLAADVRRARLDHEADRSGRGRRSSWASCWATSSSATCSSRSSATAWNGCGGRR